MRSRPGNTCLRSACDDDVVSCGAIESDVEKNQMHEWKYLEEKDNFHPPVSRFCLCSHFVPLCAIFVGLGTNT